MKTHRNNIKGIPRAIAPLCAVIFAASTFAVQGQPTQQNPTAPSAIPQKPSTNVSTGAQEFVKAAAQANQTEIAMAKVAQDKSQKPPVRELAQTLRSDHQKNYETLQVITRAHGVALDVALDAISTTELERLQKADGADFDKQYTKLVLKDHVKCINSFSRAVTEIEEQDVKQYAQNTLPELRIHLLRCEDAARSVGLDESIISSILKDLPSEDRVVSSR